ncbi:hypothetical protein [Asticcacaulis sp. 201]|uniref:hypothetical protein n=1 Tax=Asticcacaulis sp. 201 TaxID=3028787 RepID=UPI00291649EF|nr:hypothetical protein [Asticcacaulis sp. 201]MDV6332243.1 hypothetical protein [Asticcacaulis sp. 201]
MNATILPFPTPKPSPVRQVKLEGEYVEDDLPPELFDPEEDEGELAAYAHIAGTWND